MIEAFCVWTPSEIARLPYDSVREHPGKNMVGDLAVGPLVSSATYTAASAIRPRTSDHRAASNSLQHFRHPVSEPLRRGPFSPLWRRGRAFASVQTIIGICLEALLGMSVSQKVPAKYVGGQRRELALVGAVGG